MSESSESSESSLSRSPVLDRFGENLTMVAREGRLDLVFGREREIEQVMRVFSRFTKHDPVLVGEPGVGKTAIVIGLAQKMVKGEVPQALKHKQLYILNRKSIQTMMAENQSAAQPFQELLKEVQERDDIILVIDDLHALLDPNVAEKGSEWASILKLMLARGELQIIGVTTPDEYRKHVEKDSALEPIFEPVHVGELTIDDTIEVLKSLRDRYEAYHRVSITDGAVVASVQLADRYLRDGYLPGKALQLVDDAGALTRIRRMTRPPDLREYDEKILQVRQEKESAINSQDFEKAGALRDTEKQLIANKNVREKEWKADDTDAAAEVGEELIAEALAAIIGVSVDEFLESHIDIAPPDAGGASAQPYILLNDQPVDEADNDLLGSSKVAAGISSTLTASSAAAPLVMAVDAGWGMGKSTLLRQIESQLPGRPSVIPVRFNAWTAQGTNALEGLIKSVLVELDSRVIRRWAGKLRQQRHVLLIARIGLGLISRFFGLSRLVDELWSQLEVDAKSRNEARELIHEMLNEWVNANKRDNSRMLVVFVDDLDRCSDDVILEVCEAIKLYLDAPGLIFVIACDLSVLARGVSRSAPDAGSHGRAYLEKIVQVAYRLPPPDEAQSKRLIGGYAIRSGTMQLIDNNLMGIIAERTGRNPRRIKRIINSLVLEHRLNPAWQQAPLGSAQLVRAILLQHLYVTFYDLMVAEKSGEDPIEEFLDYAEVCARVNDPPAAGHPWWSTASRTYRRYGMPAPERSPSSEKRLTVDLERLEAGIPKEIQQLARDTSFIALLGGVGDKKARQALRAQLIARPLGTDLVLDES